MRADTAPSVIGGDAAAISNLLCTIDPRLASSSSAPGANIARGARVIAYKAGTIAEIAVYCETAAGDVDVAIADGTGATRNRLWSSGATIATTGWMTWSPALAVTAGQVLDFVLSSDSATATFYRMSSMSPQLPDAFDPAGASARLTWSKSSTYPIPSSWTEAAGFSNSAVIPLIVARYA